MKTRRIAGVGAGGSGKTTTLDLVAKKLNIPVEQVTTKQVRDKYLLNSQNEILAVGNTVPHIGIAFQEEMIRTRKDHFDFLCDGKCVTEFCTDRTPLDSLAYTYLQNSYWDTEEHINVLKDLVRDSADNYDYIFMFPTAVFPIENNGQRGLNREYHRMVETVIRWLAPQVGYELIDVPVFDDLEARAQWICDYVSGVFETEKIKEMVDDVDFIHEAR